MRKSVAVAISLFAVIVVGSMYMRHAGQTASHPPLRAEVAAPNFDDIAIVAALNHAKVPMDSLTVHNVGGIVLVGGTADAATTRDALAVIKDLGFTRVANLVKPATFDDESLRRTAERQLAQTRSLDGCMLKVSCSRGVIHLSGTVRSELQQDIARNVLRRVDGAHEVQVELKKL